MISNFLNGGGGSSSRDDEEEDDSSSGFSIGIPGTDYSVTTSRSEADVVSVPSTSDVTSTASSTYSSGRDRVSSTYSSGRDRVSSTGSTWRDNLGQLADPNQPAEWVPGVTEIRESETFQQRQQEYAEADSALGRFDASVAAGMDFLLDHPDASVQGGSRGLISRATGLDDDEMAERAQAIDEGVTETIDDTVEGTALDNRATDAVRWTGDVLIGEGARVLTGAATGIDTREGTTDARTGALETADVGLTVGTLGAGRLASGALRSGDNVGDLFNIGRRSGDDAADAGTTVARTGDDAARTTDDVIDLSRADDGVFRMADDAADAGGVVSRTLSRVEDATPALRGADDAGAAGARVGDDAATTTRNVEDLLPSVLRSGDDAAGAGARVGDDAAGAGARVGDDAATTGSRVVDDAAGATTRTTSDAATVAARAGETLRDLGARFGGSLGRVGSRTTTRAGRASDTFMSGASRAGSRLGTGASRAGSRLGSGLRGAGRSRAARWGIAGTALGAGVIGGGAIVTELRDRYEMADGTVLVKTDQLPPTDRLGGGVLFRVEDQETNDSLGYTVVIGEQGRNVLMLDRDGNPTTAPMSVEELHERAIAPGGPA